MKKTLAIVAACIMVGGALSLLRSNRAEKSTPLPEDDSSQIHTTYYTPRAQPEKPSPEAPPQPTPSEDSSISKETFDQLPPKDQERILEEFIEAFWAHETGESDALPRTEDYLSLDLFGRPYMHTLTESEYAQMLPEDQERAIAEVIDSAQQTRGHGKDLIAGAQEGLANNDYARAEASLISALENGRELTANRDGLLITRVVGIACQKDALTEMVSLYTRLGDHAKVERAQQQLRDLEAEKEEMRAMAQQNPQ